MNTNFFGLRELAIQKESINKSIESYLCTHFYKWFMANYPQLPVLSVTDTFDDNCVISVRFDYDMEMYLGEYIKWQLGQHSYMVFVKAQTKLAIEISINRFHFNKDLAKFLAQNKAVAKFLSELEIRYVD